MKLVFQKDALLNGINIVSKAIPSKTTMSILECILIDANTSEIKLTGNDMELGIETKVEGSILERGKIALEAKLFYEIVRKLPDSESNVTITSDEKYNTIIECENAVFNIQGRDGEEYSYLPYIERDQYICLSQFTLKEAIRQTIFSISPNDSNKMMAGELMEVNDDILKVVSLDGHRISIRNITLKDHYQSRKVIVPGKTLSEISKTIQRHQRQLTAEEKTSLKASIDNRYQERAVANGSLMMCEVQGAKEDFIRRWNTIFKEYPDVFEDSDCRKIIHNLTEDAVQYLLKIKEKTL